MKHLIASVSTALMLLVAGCPSMPQPIAGPAMRKIAGGTVEHTASGMLFPLARGDFKRVGIRQYDPAGLNVSAAYNSSAPSTPIAITIYVYPSPSVQSIGSPAAVVAEAKSTLARAEFQEAKSEILRARPAAKLVGEVEVPPPRRAAHDRGYFARFAYTENFAGRVQPVESLLYLYSHVGERWTVKYRITYPASLLDARALVNGFIQDLEWTVK